MNIAYLVLAHGQPKQLQRLVDRLQQPNAYFFIHFDKKYKDFELVKSLLAGYKNVRLVSEFKVYWGGFNTVKAAQLVMRLAYESGIAFKYYMYLSGLDYPIKSNAYINEFFEKHNCDFISFHKMDFLPPSFKNKYRYFHFLDFKYINPREPEKIKLLYYLNYGFYNRFGKYIPHRRFYKDFTPYFGSDWFTLTHETVKYVLDFAANHPDYTKFMTYTDIPNELFVHNILLNSPRKTNICDYGKYEEWLKTRKEGELFNPSFSTLKYMDWSERGKPKPATLDMTYYQDIKDSPDLFARKVDEKISAELMDRIDKTLL